MTTKEEMNSIQMNAKIAGALYLLIAVLAGFVHFYVPANFSYRAMLGQQPVRSWLLKGYSVWVLPPNRIGVLCSSNSRWAAASSISAPLAWRLC